MSVAIAGLGITEMGKVFGHTPSDLAAEAIQLAVADAGLQFGDIDGLLLNPGVSAGGLGIELARAIGLQDLSLLQVVNGYGSSAGAMVQTAALAVDAGMATTVVCVFADAPVEAGQNIGAAFSGERAPQPKGFRSVAATTGIPGAAGFYGLAARRHMAAFGTNEDHFAAVAVNQRDWATSNPRAQKRAPMTVEDHHNSRWIAEPFRLFDCCLVSNGGVAVVVTSADRAADLRQPPVHVWGWGQGHPGYPMEHGSEFGITSGAVQSSRSAYAMAGITSADVDVAELYDCFTFTVIISLEDYGFCAKGEGGPFAASGALGRRGSLPTNTGGGQLSSFYMWGMTPMSEGVIQARGQGGERQVDRHDIVLVSGNGGILDFHSTVVLGTHPRSSRG